MNLELLLLFLGVMLVIIGFSKQMTDNKRKIEIKYIPRDIYDELVMNSVLK